MSTAALIRLAIQIVQMVMSQLTNLFRLLRMRALL